MYVNYLMNKDSWNTHLGLVDKSEEKIVEKMARPSRER